MPNPACPPPTGPSWFWLVWISHIEHVSVNIRQTVFWCCKFNDFELQVGLVEWMIEFSEGLIVVLSIFICPKTQSCGSAPTHYLLLNVLQSVVKGFPPQKKKNIFGLLTITGLLQLVIKDHTHTLVHMYEKFWAAKFIELANLWIVAQSHELNHIVQCPCPRSWLEIRIETV